ncbi:MAG: DUF167 domain-containing protein [archaeon]
MIIKVKVKPGSGKQEVVKLNEEEFVVSLKERAEDNKANIELLKLLRRYFKEKYKVDDIKIIKGLKSRNKIVEVINANKI